jgi:cardiolipin synthase
MTAIVAFLWANLLTIISWTIRIGALIVVPFRRSPAAARSWLLLFFIAPMPALLLFLAIGSPRHPKKRRERFAELPGILLRSLEKAGLDRHEMRADIDNRLTPVAKLGSGLAAFPPLEGNHIELLPDYEETIDALVAAIDGAEHHVHLQYYIFAHDRTGLRIIDAVARARMRGVHCRVLIDAFGSFKWAKDVVARFETAGAEAHRILPWHLRRNASRIDLRNHRKIAVIDGKVGFTGSQNIIDAHHTPDGPGGPANIELVVQATGPIVAELQAVFLGDWYMETTEVLDDDQLFTAAPSGEMAAQFVPSGPNYLSGGIDLLLADAMHLAREEIVIVTPYFIPNDSILTAMKSAALRGVKVRIVLSRHTEGQLVMFAQRSYFAELIEAGIELSLYENDFVHAKHMRIDGDLAVIGSCNMDERSFRLNAEASMVCYGTEVAGALAAIEARYFANVTVLDATSWENRSIATKTLENSARMLSDLL